MHSQSINPGHSANHSIASSHGARLEAKADAKEDKIEIHAEREVFDCAGIITM